MCRGVVVYVVRFGRSDAVSSCRVHTVGPAPHSHLCGGSCCLSDSTEEKATAENGRVVSRLRTLVGKRQRGSQYSGRARSTTLASLCTRNSDPRKAQRNKYMNKLQEEVARQDLPLGASVSPSDPLTLCASPALTRLACLCCPGQHS